MPTYVLEGGSSVTLPAKPLTLRVQGGGAAEIRLEAWRDGHLDDTALSPMPGMLVLPRVTAGVEIRVVPLRQRTFASATVIALAATIEVHGDPDPERAVMQGVDLSGLAQRDLLNITPDPTGLRLTALGVVVDVPLPPLAARARDIARELLGTERVDADDARALLLRVDASASMRPHVLDGSVGAALEVLIGVTRVTSADEPVTAEVGVLAPQAVPADTVADVPRAVHETIVGLPLLTGFRSATPLSGHQRGALLCVLSDGVPADLPSDSPAALVVIATPSAREVLTSRAPDATGWIPVGATQSAYAILTENEPALRETVWGILRALLPAQSRLAPRLADGAQAVDVTMVRARY